MIRTTIVIFVLLIGCAIPPEPKPKTPLRYVPIPESQFVGQYPSLVGKFKGDYPNLIELSHGYHGDYFKYVMPDGRILTARRDEKKPVWNVRIREPHHSDVQKLLHHMGKGEGLY